MEKKLISVCLAIFTLALFWSTSQFDFIWTDSQEIVENPSINPPSFSGFLSLWTDDSDHKYVPLARTTQFTASLLSRVLLPHENAKSLNPTIFKFINIIFHAVNVALVFLILSLCFDSLLAAFFGALLFAVHPIQIEPVVWASALPFVMGSFFGLLSIWKYLSFAVNKEGQIDSFLPNYRPLYWATLFFVFALLAHPAMAVVPFILLIIDKFVPRGLSFYTTERSVLPLIIWALIAIPVVALAVVLQNTGALSDQVAYWQRPIIAFNSFTFFVSKIIAPIEVGPDYGMSPAFLFQQSWLYVTCLAPFGLFGLLLFWKSESRRWVSCGLMIMILGLLPYLGFVLFEEQGFSTVANRYAYLAMLGPALIFGHFIAARKRQLVVVGAMLLVGCLSYLTIQNSQYWRNDKLLWEYALKVNKKSPLAHQILAEQYRKQGDLSKAREHYMVVTETNSTNPEAHRHLADIEYKIGEKEKAKVLYEKAIALDGNYATAYNNLGMIFLSEKNYKQALIHFEKAVSLATKGWELLYNLGSAYVLTDNQSKALPVLEKALEETGSGEVVGKSKIHALLGTTLKSEKPEEAQGHLEKALELDANNPEANLAMGDVYFDNKEMDKALEKFQKAKTGLPENWHILSRIGVIYFKTEKYTAAHEHLEKALKLDPKDARSLTYLAATEFYLRRIDLAEANLDKVLELNPKIADTYYYLGEIARWRGQGTKSLHYYYQTLKREKRHPLAHFRLGNHFDKEEKYGQAASHYRTSLKTEPENRRFVSALKRAEAKLE